jgi:glutaredoxin
MDEKRVNLVLYRYAGKFLFFRITERCSECDISYVVLQQLMTESLHGKPVSLRFVPWLDNWWRPIWRGGWHAPILTVNKRIFSQGVVPDVQKLLHRIGLLLGDPSVEKAGVPLTAKTQKPRKSSKITVYHSPACPHCRKLLAYLEANSIDYTPYDVTKSESARQEIRNLTGGMAIPVTVVDGRVVVGFKLKVIGETLGISAGEQQIEEKSSKSIILQIDKGRMKRIFNEARAILEGNWLGGWTMPSKELYPHLWNWDSGFIARGYLHFRPERAYQELFSLFRGQWSDGFLPHIVFNPSYIDHFPGPSYWKAQRSGKLPEGMYTSGISQPPVHASMMVRAVELDPDRGRAQGFLKEIYPKLRKFHDFFFNYRDPHSENLVYIVHPWESGLDNSPLWDEPLAVIKGATRWASQMQRAYDRLAEEGKRPKRAYIEKYSFLVENLFSCNYDWNRIADVHPFKVQDVLFNSILCKSESDLAVIAKLTGHDPAPHLERAQMVREALNGKLWVEDQGLYCNFDLTNNKMINRDTIFSYLPLFAEVPGEEEGKILLDELRSHCFCVADGDCVAIPSYDMCQADFEGEFYWRGPVWININWYLAKGVRKYGDGELADWIEDSLIALTERYGYYEYYDPNTGKGLGAKDFSWTAALIIDLVSDRLRTMR